jgi:protein O-mannosyl-transferase
MAALRQKPAFMVMALALLVLLLYSPVNHFAFLRWDDSQYVTDNPHVSSGVSLANIRWALTETTAYYWHPLAHISHMTDCQIFGLNAGSHHLVNVLIHAINVCFLFLLLMRATGAFWRSAMVASLFAVHPLNVETVAWVVERKSLLCTFFSLLTFAAYGWYAQKPSVKRYAAIAAAFLLALMSKPMAVTIPVLLLVVDYWPLQRSGSKQKLALEKSPLLLLSAASSALTFFGQRAAGAISDATAIPPGMRIEQAFVSYVTYIIKLFWPANLAVFYPYIPHWPAVWQVAGAVCLLTVLTVLLVKARFRRYGLAGWLFFLVAMLPVIGLVQVGGVIIADRFVYVPAIGIFVALVWFGADLFERFRVPVAMRLSVCLVSVALLGMTASRYLSYWENGLKLFTRAAAVAPAPHYMIEDLIGDSLIAENRVDEALQRYERSCQLNPVFDLCHYNIAEIRFTRYNVRGAIEEYQLAGQYTQNRAIAVNSLVNSADALMQLGDANTAQSQLSNALALDPGNERARRMLAMIAR